MLRATLGCRLMNLALSRRKQGFDPSVTADSIYYADPGAKAFVPMDRSLYERISNGEIRL